MLFADLADVSARVAATPARSAKVALIAQALRDAHQGVVASRSTGDGEVEIVASYLVGELRQRRTGVGWATIRDPVPTAGTPTRTLDQAISSIEGA